MPCGDSSTLCARRQVTTDLSPCGLSAAAAAPRRHRSHEPVTVSHRLSPSDRHRQARPGCL